MEEELCRSALVGLLRGSRFCCLSGGGSFACAPRVRQACADIRTAQPCTTTSEREGNRESGAALSVSCYEFRSILWNGSTSMCTTSPLIGLMPIPHVSLTSCIIDRM